ncbi:MAG: hypothetical protein ACTS6J_12385 [Burkholderiales bacterium]
MIRPAKSKLSMFAGEQINASDNRAMLHVALRCALATFPAGGGAVLELDASTDALLARLHGWRS